MEAVHAAHRDLALNVNQKIRDIVGYWVEYVNLKCFFKSDLK